MAGYAAKRFAWAIALCFSLSLVTFVLFSIVPTNSVQVRGGGFTDLRKSSQLTGPILEQYGQWISHVATGSLGRSFFSRHEVNDILSTQRR